MREWKTLVGVCWMDGETKEVRVGWRLSKKKKNPKTMGGLQLANDVIEVLKA